MPHLFTKLLALFVLHLNALLTAVVLAQPMIAQLNKKPLSHWLSLPSVWVFTLLAPYVLLVLYGLVYNPAGLIAQFQAFRRMGLQAGIKKATKDIPSLLLLGGSAFFLLIFILIHLTKIYLNGSFNY